MNSIFELFLLTLLYTSTVMSAEHFSTLIDTTYFNVYLKHKKKRNIKDKKKALLIIFFCESFSTPLEYVMNFCIHNGDNEVMNKLSTFKMV